MHLSGQTARVTNMQSLHLSCGYRLYTKGRLESSSTLGVTGGRLESSSDTGVATWIAHHLLLTQP